MVCSRKTADTLLIMRHECLGECCHHVMFQVGRPCSILPTKESEYRCCPSRGPVAALHHERPARRERHGFHGSTCHMAVASMDPARGNGRTRALGGEKNREAKQDEGREVCERVREDKKK